MKRILYFGYFIKNTNYRNLKTSFKEVKKNEKLSYHKIFMDMIMSSFKYKSSFHDYFMFEFYKKNNEQRDSYLTTGMSYEFYTALNDKKYIHNFRNKAEFNEIFGEFIKRDFLFLDTCILNDFIEWVNDKEYIMAKPNDGVAERGIEKICVKDYNTPNDLYNYLIKKKLNLVEECIQQHPKMNMLNPSSVNTIRIITVSSSRDIDIIYAFIRIGVDSYVDNFSAGGIAAPIDIETGIVNGHGISKNYSIYHDRHPETNIEIRGFKIPFWRDTLNLIMKASKVIPQVKTVGWDVAITEKGPELIEGNDNWGKDAFQLLDGIGKKNLLVKYL